MEATDRIPSDSEPIPPVTVSRALLVPVALLISLAGAAGNAQDNAIDLRNPVTIYSEHSTFDGKTGVYVYTGLQLTQGNIHIEADEGRVTLREQEDGEWRFAGNVLMSVDGARIECDAADLTFEQSVLTTAHISGAPATFELQRSGADDITRASAGRLVYDVKNGIVEFSEAARITESGNEIASNTLVYNIKEQRVDADASGVDGDRVRITYTPTNGDIELPQSDEDSGNQ